MGYLRCLHRPRREPPIRFPHSVPHTELLAPVCLATTTRIFTRKLQFMFSGSLGVHLLACVICMFGNISWYQSSRLIQMATCGEDYLLNCRFAGRGSGQVVFNSHGLSIQETDPKVVIRDENVGKEEHPDDRDGRKIQETNPRFVIRDESHGKEEHPEDGDINYYSPPCFDNYGNEEMNMEDYLWVAKALNGVAIQEGKPLKGFDFWVGSVRCVTNDTVGVHENALVQDLIEYAKTPADIFDLKGVAVTTGGAMITTGAGADSVDSVCNIVPIGGRVLDGCDAPSVETPTEDPMNMVDLNFSSINMASSKLLKIQINEINEDAKYVDMPTAITDNILNVWVTQYYVCEHDMMGPKVDVDHYMNFDELHKVIINYCGPMQTPPKVEDGVIFGEPHVTSVHLKVQKINGHFNLNDNLPNEGKDMKIVWLPYKGDKLSEETRPDVPFDPGGFGTEAKLEDEFFLKIGSMMRGIIIIF